MLPGLARVGGFVDAVADGEIGAAQAFSAADVDDIWIRGRDGEGSDGAGGLSVIRLIIEDGIPGAAGVGRLPDSAVVGRHVEDVGLGGNAGDGDGASAAKGADGAPAEILEHSGIVGLGGERERNEQEAELGEQNAKPRKTVVHG